jgi:hypothetical protein
MTICVSLIKLIRLMSFKNALPDAVCLKWKNSLCLPKRVGYCTPHTHIHSLCHTSVQEFESFSVFSLSSKTSVITVTSTQCDESIHDMAKSWVWFECVFQCFIVWGRRGPH